MKYKFFLVLFLVLFSIKSSRAQKQILSISNNLETVTDSFPWINQTTKVNGDAFSGNYYSSTDSLKEYGLGYKGAFPVSCRNKNLHINLSEFVRANVLGKEFFMVINILFGDSLIVWESKNISARLLKPNLWTEMKDEFEIPSSLTGEGYNFAFYLWNKDGKSKVDIDDLRIDFAEKNMPSFLPVGFTTNRIDSGWKILSSNENFKLFYNQDVKQVQILNTKGDTIINSLALFSEWTDLKKNELKHSWNYQFNLRKDSVSEEGNYIMLMANNEILQSEITILVGNKNNISFKINSALLLPITLFRHSIICAFNMPVSEVYKKSTLTDSTNFKDEYWLNKEGFKLSNGQSSIVLYRPEEVSSLQLDVKNKLAIINLDYSADHPLLHFPLLKKSENIFEDYSASVYSKGDLLKSSFTFYSVPPKFCNATLLSNSYGYLSSFVWTEHADYTDLRTQKAVYLGSEKINQLDEATGGFLKYSIPVTKSIFYANPDKVDNSDKAGFITGPIANYKETAGYRDFLKFLFESGIEICLHTPDHFTSSKKLLSEALDVTKREFFPSTWIDHGYDNSKMSNRENLTCDGADIRSQWYSVELWKKYGIKYFWNPFYEDSQVFKEYSYNSFFSVPYSGWDDAMPTPLFWRNKTRTADLIHWGTANTTDPVDGNLWSYYFNDLRLNDLINNRNNIIVHSYPARVDSTNGYYTIDDGIVKVNEEFNSALSKLSSLRLQEKIRLTTIRDILDFRTSIENISYEILSNGNIRLHNSSRAIIRGLSFSTLAKDVEVEGKEIKRKVVGNEHVFWFDLSPDEYVTLKLN